MIKNIVAKLRNNICCVVNLLVLILVVHLYLSIKSIEVNDIFKELTGRLDSISGEHFQIWQDKHPPVTNNQDFQGEKSNFDFSPDRKYISFVQNVFEEYGEDWDRYWALKIFEPATGTERTLVVDSTKMSSYLWLDNKTLRVFHNAGTGFRVYLDVSAEEDSPLFTKDYEGPDIWRADEEYSKKAKDTVEARNAYLEATQN